MRKALFFSLFVFSVLGGIALIFWQQEYKYILPTPVPENLKTVNSGDSVSLQMSGIDLGKKTFIHFYNNDCPCSRFNIKEFSSMVRRFDDSVRFIAIIQSEENNPDALEEFRAKYDLGIDIYPDPDGKIAEALGVYSTPQAVIVDNHTIFYKGNYNRARFCVSRNTKFAELALEALLSGEQPPEFPEVALTAYGCELPSNQNESEISSLISIF